MIRILTVAFCCMITATAWGQNLMYTGEAPVADQSAAERSKALPVALAQVLSKHSGLAELPPNPEIRAALGRAPQMLLTYSYRTVFEIGEDGTEFPTLRLVAQFLPQPVDQLVRSLPIQRWPTPRDPMAMWVVVDDGLDRRVQPRELRATWTALTQQARDRGLELSFPEVAEDVDPQTVQLLWGGFTDPLRETHPRQVILIAAARQDGGLWRVQMALDDQQRQQRLTVTDASLVVALQQGLEQAVDQLVAASVIAPQDSGQWAETVVIGGLHDENAWLRTAKYLRELEVVDQVRLVSARPGQVTVALQLNASPEYFARTLEGGRVLQPGRQGQDWEYLP